MKKLKFCLDVFVCVCLFLNGVTAQDKSGYKFGKISQADFIVPVERIDSGANAVIISDIGSTRFEGNDDGSFTLIFTRYMRVKIINRNGVDIGKYSIYLYHNDDGKKEKSVC